MKFLFNAILILLLVPALTFGQKKVKSFSNVYVPSGSFMSIFGSYEFSGDAGTGKLKTSRNLEKGYVNFGVGSEWMGQADNQFIDGYVCVHHGDSFTFPIGHESIYAPVAISGAEKTAAAFFNANPEKINGFATNLSADLGNVSDIGYWDVKSPNNTRLTLSYNDIFDISELTAGDLNKLTIVGLQNNEWKVISSSLDSKALNKMSSEGAFKGVSDLTSGSITTDEEINPNDYDYFSLATIENEQLLSNIDFNVFPNPSMAGNDINIDYEMPTNGNLQVFNTANELIYTQALTEGTGVIQLNRLNLHEGSYYISFIDDKGFVKSEKLIVVNK